MPSLGFPASVNFAGTGMSLNCEMLRDTACCYITNPSLILTDIANQMRESGSSKYNRYSCASLAMPYRSRLAMDVEPLFLLLLSRAENLQPPQIGLSTHINRMQI